MAPNALLGIALLAALGLAGCTAGEDTIAVTAEAQTKAAQSTLAATTPILSERSDSAMLALTENAVADSVERAREIEVMRETFAYGGGNRDPFNSLINAATSGPEIGDLDLVGVYQNLRSPSDNVVVLREKVGAKRHKLRVGDQVGRARLVRIQPRDAVFVIQDFGFERQVTLSLRKQEVETP
ncbi:MAG: hypothetical protein M3477_02105 [Gemmatimonadota bacterium]|nr:hypothetical protein [Gemmatimonadota bacterium]